MHASASATGAPKRNAAFAAFKTGLYGCSVTLLRHTGEPHAQTPN